MDCPTPKDGDVDACIEPTAFPIHREPIRTFSRIGIFFLTNTINSSQFDTHGWLQADGLASYQPRAQPGEALGRLAY